MKKKKILLSMVLALLLLAGCGNNTADWEDTLPSAVTTATESSVSVIEAETNPPISISVPETTTSTERNTELATTAEATATSPTSGITTAGTTAAATETASVPTTVSTSESTAQSTTGETTTPTSSETQTETTTATTAAPKVREDGEYVFVKGQPISRAYVYEMLSENEKKAYDIMLNAIKAHESSFELPYELGISGDEYVDLYQLIFDFEYSIFDLGVNIRYTTDSRSGTVVEAQLSYLYTAEQVVDMQKKIDVEANKILSDITDGMSEVEIVKLFYDRLASEIEYNEKAENLRDIYGAFVDKSTVCGGFAKAFSYLCSRVGIESITITGDFNETPHMWNMVRIGSDWYHIDVTAGNAMDTAFPYIRYDYFCVTDEVIKKYHTIYEQSFEYPQAESERYNYYIYNGLIAYDDASAANLIADEIINASEKGIPAVQFICSDDKAYEDVIFYLFDPTQRHALDIYENTYDSAVKKYNVESIQYHSDPQTRVIKLFLQFID